MKYRKQKRLSKRQLAVIDELFAGGMDEAEVLQRYKVSTRLYREWLADHHPNVPFIDVAPELGKYGYLSRLPARAMIMRGYGAGLRALAAEKENRVFDELLPPESDQQRLRTAG